MRTAGVVSCFLLVLAVFPAVAQSTANAPAGNQPETFAVTFTSNVPGAGVFVDGVPVQRVGPADAIAPAAGTRGTPVEAQLSVGRHDIRFAATGFEDWNRTIEVRSVMTVDATLVPAKGANVHSVMISANINGASVSVDGYELAQGTPVRVSLSAGTHSVRVSRDGYTDWTKTFDLATDTIVRADLSPADYALNVISNVSGAVVTISEITSSSPPFQKTQSGSVPYHLTLGGGSYIITLTADGYLPFTTTVTLTADETVRAVMIPAVATIELSVPDRYRNPFDPKYLGRIEWYVDGQRYAGVSGSSIQVTSGAHDIRLVSGGFSISGRFVFQAGRVYRLEPALQLRLQE
ncbi:MAG TPA: PEGA domain-containing protein [Spirochaetia bacterium]|nr:PEGA domain-containing protein [Spirochaetia bacterium]